jgi:ATP synthase subunit 6
MVFSPLEQFEILYTLLPQASCIMYDPNVSFSAVEYLLKFLFTADLTAFDDVSSEDIVTFQNIFTEEEYALVSEFQDEQFAEEQLSLIKLEFFTELTTNVCRDTIEGELAYYLIELSILDYEEGEKENINYCSDIIFFFLDEQPVISSIIYADMSVEERVDFVYFVGDELFDYSPADCSALEKNQVCPTGNCPVVTTEQPKVCPMPGANSAVVEIDNITEAGQIIDTIMELSDKYNLFTLEEIANIITIYMVAEFDKNKLEEILIIYELFDLCPFIDTTDMLTRLGNNIDLSDYYILRKNMFNLFNIPVYGLDFINSKNSYETVTNAFNYAVTYKPVIFHSYSNILYYIKYFIIAILHPVFLGLGNISTNLLFTLFSLLFLIVLMFLLFSLQFFLVPRNAHLFMLYYYSFIKSIIVDLINHQTGKQYYFQLIAFLFVILNLLNIYGLIPYTFVLTSQFSFTFFCSFIFFSALNFTGITVHGLHLFSLFFPSGAPIFISPLLVVIEFISYFARVFSLAIRLFANITAGHILLKILSWFTWSMLDIIFASILSTIIITVLWVLEFFISVLQAYVFTILVCIYLNDVLNLH